MSKVETIHWHTLLPEYLGPSSRVLDLGANYGLFAKAITERFGCQCVAIEPSPKPFASIQTNKLICKRQIAIGGKSGKATLQIDEANSLASALGETAADANSITVEVETLDEIFFKLGWSQIDLLKVDIEGAEIEMLSACSDKFLEDRVAQISIEFHDFCGITPPEVVKSTLDRLHRLKFYSVRMSRVGHQDTLIINSILLPKIAAFDILFIRFFYRNWFGLKRVTKRLFDRLKAR